MKTTFLIAGYQSADLSIFTETDPRVKIIKKAIRRRLIMLLENGVEWFVFMGNLGFEYWALEVVLELRAEGYECQLATVFCFANHGQHWNERNQLKLSHFKQVDFIKYCYESYETPRQLKDYQAFLLDNTDGLFLFYEPDYPTKLNYLYKAASNKADYEVYRLGYDELNDLSVEEDEK